MRTIFLTYLLLLSPTLLLGQGLLYNSNSIPPTKLIKAPGAHITKNYKIHHDNSKDILLIKEESRHSETKELHSIQMMFEIPTEYLSSSGFIVEKDEYSNELRIMIELNEVSQIHAYWIDDNEVISILLQSKCSLGPWTYSEESQKNLQVIAKSLGDKYGKTEEKVGSNKVVYPIYKFGSDRAMMVGNKDLDGKLYNDYYYAHSLTNPPPYGNVKTIGAIERKMRNSIKKQLDKTDQALIGTPVFIYVSPSGEIESIFLGIAKGDALGKSITLDGFKDGGKINRSPVSSKFVLIL